MNRKIIDTEYGSSNVPQTERKGIKSLVFIWIGYLFTVTIMSAGGNIANGSTNFIQSLEAVYVGYALLFIIAYGISLISMKTGLSFGLLTRYTFGNYGSKIISLFVTLTLMGWFSINCDIVGSMTNILFPQINGKIITILFGLLFTLSALKGKKAMNKIGLLATALVGLIGVLAIVIGFKDASKLGGIFNITKESTRTFNELVTISVGSVVCGCIAWAPDVMRFAKDKKTILSTMGIGLGICGPFMLLIGIIGMMVYGKYDIALILQEQGFLAYAWIALIANVWSTAQGNVYSSSLNLTNIFPKINRKYFVYIFGGLGTILALFGIYKNFSSWLSFMATIFPPLGGVIISDFIFYWKKDFPQLKDIRKNIRFISFISFIIGILISKIVNVGIVPINSFITSFFIQMIASIIQNISANN